MVRIGGSTEKGRHIKESDYFTPQGEFRVDREGSPTPQLSHVQDVLLPFWTSLHRARYGHIDVFKHKLITYVAIIW